MSNLDQELDDGTIRLAAKGVRDAQRRIYEKYGNQVYRTIERIVGQSDADDVLQDAFIRLFQKLPTFRFESAFSTWIHRVMVNEALQHLRKRKRKLMTTNFDRQPEPEIDKRPFIASEVAEVITQAMKQIEPELRRIFELKAIDELSYAEIAEIVGIPEGTVGSRLNRARRELRDQLIELGWEG
ncbi:MAG TPA: RNA polymerase sigma factor [Pirellulaceae bacterium]|nr:RNA polymerase sigma factor [Pirellulaceae bacterium]HMO93766.1 RNA polymerase sigma factor [Pirellulaceae bacterium]HMP71617.1 RNA polymerase sigma factor [Pirellulaceae bacterium]